LRIGQNEDTKVYGYLRVSGRGQLRGDGFTRQSLAIERYCAANGHQLVRTFREKAVPGATDMADRPAWREMVGEILADGVKVIVIERLDRLARDLMPLPAPPFRANVEDG
jgi:DNA invertase Pin-like site-specific DNA recombinase